MLKVFISSTFRDLRDLREELLDKINKSLVAIGMETFIPDGSESHKKSLDELRKSDIIIFLISAYYGSIINKCKLKKQCNAECPIKTGGNKISYTHCEYKTALAENKPHLTYIIENEWDIITELDKIKGKKFELKEIRKNDYFDKLDDNTLKHYFKVRKKVLKFKKEISEELYKPINLPKDLKNLFKIISIILENLADKIVEWHSEGIISFKDFCGRHQILKDLIQKVDESVEIYGVGGIGKTSVVQIALLIEKLRGKRIISLGTSQSYSTGSGYQFFREKCKNEQYITTSNKISLDDILKALKYEDTDDIWKLNRENQVNQVVSKLNNENTILFVDDFHLADNEVINLVKKHKNIIISSRKKSDIARYEINLQGVIKSERDNLINIIIQRVGGKLTEEARNKIREVTEGHPVSTEILVRNYERIDFNNIENFKSTFLLSKPEHMDEFLKRVVKEILGNEAFILLKNLSIINNDIKNNLNRLIIKKSYKKNNFDFIFNELIDTGMLKKKENNESNYEFTYRHIKDLLEEGKNINYHENALNYYKNKIMKYGNNIDDEIENFYHKSVNSLTGELIVDFLKLGKNLNPSHHSFMRFFSVLLNIEYNTRDKHYAELLLHRGNGYYLLRNYNLAKINYENSEKIWNEIKSKDKDAKYNLILIKNNIGNIYRIFGDTEKAKKLFLDALEKSKNLVNEAPKIFLPYTVKVLINLGTFCGDLSDNKKAKEFLLEAIDTLKEIEDKNTEDYLNDCYSVLNNLGITYKALQQYSDSEQTYKRALEVLKKLLKLNYENYILSLANCHSNLGNLYYYWNSSKFGMAENEFKQVIEIYKSLVKKNPEVYSTYLGGTKNALGVLLTDINEFDKAEIEFKEALEILEKHKYKFPLDYLPHLANAQINLARLYAISKNEANYEESEKLMMQALLNFQFLYEKNPNVYLPKVAMTIEDLGKFFYFTKNYGRAERELNEALKLYRQLAENNRDSFLPKIADILKALGKIYIDTDKKDEAKTVLNDVYDIYTELSEGNQELYLNDVIEIQNVLIRLENE